MEIQLSQGVHLMGTKSSQGIRLGELGTSSQARHIKELVTWISTQAFNLDISRSSSHGPRHKLSSLAYQGVHLMDIGTSFQARHKLMPISFILPDT